MKKILLVDLAYIGPLGGGHNESYLIRFASILSSNNYYIYLCSGNNKELKTLGGITCLKTCEIVDLNLRLTDKLARRSLIALDRVLSRFAPALSITFASLVNILNIRRLLRDIGEDIPVFLAHAESSLPAVPVSIAKFLMPKQWSGFYVLPSYQSDLQFDFNRSRLLFKKEENLGLPSCKSILVLHPQYQRFFSKRFKNLSCFYLPEMVEDYPAISQERQGRTTESEPVDFSLLDSIKEQAQGRPIIAMLGNITPRKDPLLFLSAMAKLPEGKFFVLLLGRLKALRGIPFSKDFIEKISYYKAQLSSDSYIDTDYFIQSEKEFYALIAISHVIYLVYKNHPFSSSILTKAMACRKPVLVNHGYLMENTVKAYNWKAVVNAEVVDIASSVKYLIDSDYVVDDVNHLRFLQDHSPDRFESSVLTACSKFNYCEQDS